MRAHTKRHRIERDSVERDSVVREEEKSISSVEFIENAKKELNLPMWAISLAGLRYRENLT